MKTIDEVFFRDFSRVFVSEHETNWTGHDRTEQDRTGQDRIVDGVDLIWIVFCFSDFLQDTTALLIIFGNTNKKEALSARSWQRSGQRYGLVLRASSLCRTAELRIGGVIHLQIQRG